jgi:hypothetical protein
LVVKISTAKLALRIGVSGVECHIGFHVGSELFIQGKGYMATTVGSGTENYNKQQFKT